MSRFAKTACPQSGWCPFVRSSEMTLVGRFRGWPFPLGPKRWSHLSQNLGAIGGPLILLDTCTFLWLGQAGSPIPPRVVEAIRRTPPSERYVSSISAFEIGFKFALGKLSLPLAPSIWFAESCAQRGIHPLPLTESIAMRAALLPLHHRDPADRFIISTAQELDLTVLTPDAAFRDYEVRLLWE